MKNRISSALSLSLSALILLSTMIVTPVFSGFPPRSYLADGAGAATFEIVPQDTNVTSTKPIDLRENEWFSIQVRIKDHSHVAYWQVKLIYKTALLYTSADNITGETAVDYIFRGMGKSSWTASTGVFNATHTYALFGQGTNPYAEAPSRADDSAATVEFKILADPDGPSGVLSTMLYFWITGAGRTYTLDFDLADNDCTVLDGYFENRYVPPPPAYLEISPAVKEMPVIEGDRIVGTSDAFFSVDILINDVDPADELFLVQLELYYRDDLIRGIWVDEGSFMSNSTWAIHGTTDNSTIIDPWNATCSKMIYWVMIDPNHATGIWDNAAWPSGDGLLATVRFEVIWQGEDSDGIAPKELLASTALQLRGVFNHFFLGHPNLPDPVYLAQGAPKNGRVDIYGYYWKAPTAVKTHDPTTPLVDQIVTFDGTGSTAYENVDGVMVPNPALIDTYFWDFGDGENDTGAIVFHAYAAMGDYTVTLTVNDTDGKIGTTSQIVTVIFGRLIDVFVGPGTGPYPAPYGGQGQNKVADMFEPQKTVCVYALVTYNGDPVQSKLVTFIVISPHNLHDFSRTAITNGTGYAYIEFGLPWPCQNPVDEIFGIWNITVKVDIRSVVVEDTVAFKVWWLIEITSIVPKATEFVKGGEACFDIYFRTYRMQPIEGVLELTVYDDLDVPFGSIRMDLHGIGWGNYTWCMFKNYTEKLCVDVPKWAFVGTGTAYANAFHIMMSNPYHMGSPYCPEKQATFKILKAP